MEWLADTKVRAEGGTDAYLLRQTGAVSLESSGIVIGTIIFVVLMSNTCDQFFQLCQMSYRGKPFEVHKTWPVPLDVRDLTLASLMEGRAIVCA